MHPSIHAQTSPDKPAYRMAGSGQAVSYRQLDEGSNRLAHYLRSLGVNAGDRIALMLENHPRYFEICWAAQRAGIVYTAISSRLTAGEAAYIVNDCGAKVFISSMALARQAGELLGHTPALQTRLMLDGTIDGYTAYEQAVAGQPTTPVADPSAGGDMLYSSGTTGRPKGIVRPLPETSPAEPLPLFHFLHQLWRYREDMVYLSPAPLYHSAPNAAVSLTLGVGDPAVCIGWLPDCGCDACDSGSPNELEQLDRTHADDLERHPADLDPPADDVGGAEQELGDWDADHGDLALRFEGRVGLRGTSRAAFRGESLNCIPLDEMASPGVTARTGASSCPRAGRVGSGRRGGQLAGLAPPDLV